MRRVLVLLSSLLAVFFFGCKPQEEMASLQTLVDKGTLVAKMSEFVMTCGKWCNFSPDMAQAVIDEAYTLGTYIHKTQVKEAVHKPTEKFPFLMVGGKVNGNIKIFVRLGLRMSPTFTQEVVKIKSTIGVLESPSVESLSRVDPDDKVYEQKPRPSMLGNGTYKAVGKAMVIELDTGKISRAAEVWSTIASDSYILEDQERKFSPAFLKNYQNAANATPYVKSLIPLYHWSSRAYSFFGGYIYGWFEPAFDGDLLSFTEETPFSKSDEFTTEKACHLMDSILLGAKTLESQGIIHRDIKLENILVATKEDSKGKKLPQGAISDCDFCFLFDPQNIPKTRSGSPAYVAPEIWAKPPGYSMKYDQWAYGSTFWAMLFGSHFLEYRNLYKRDGDLNDIINYQVLTLPLNKREFVTSLTPLFKGLLALRAKDRWTLRDARIWLTFSKESPCYKRGE